MYKKRFNFSKQKNFDNKYSLYVVIKLLKKKDIKNIAKNGKKPAVIL